MRISDWSSDVCSSDLIRTRTVRRRDRLGRWVRDGEADSCADRDEPRRDRHAGRRGTRQGPDQNRILGSLAAAHESEFPGIPRNNRGGDGGLRSEGGRVGKEGGSKCRYRWWSDKKK